jgi:hypothetical protein
MRLLIQARAGGRRGERKLEIRDVLTLLVLIAVMGGLVAYFLWILFYWPQSDLTRLKAKLEGEGRHVVAVRRDGVQFGGRYGPHFRRYIATVKQADGSTREQPVGVEATLLGYPSVRIYRGLRYQDDD